MTELCKVEAVWVQFCYVSSFFWMSAIAITMFFTVVKQKQTMWKYQKLYHLLIWPIPTICAIFLATSKYTGESGL